MYSPDKPFTVYCPSCFHSDTWEALDFGREYDFSRPFFEQWQELLRAVPHLSLLQENVVKSPWVNYETDEKNCYLNVGGHYNKDSAYNQYALESQEVFDNFWLVKSEFCYENILSSHCYKTFFSKLCTECRDTWFSLDCRNCSNVFGCVGLRNKQYYLFNEFVGKEMFEKFLRENDPSSQKNLKALKDRVRSFYKTVPQRATFVDGKSVNCSGNFIIASKNCKLCWNTEESEDVTYGLFALNTRDSMDITSVWWGERFYDAIGGGKSFHVTFSACVLPSSRDIEYSNLIFSSENCFGCINVKRKKYCILNKQYSKDDYTALVERIKKQMKEIPYIDKAGRVYRYGEFPPGELSPFGYNETIANEYFPLTKEEANERSFSWSDYESDTHYAFSDYIIPDSIAEVKDDITEKVFKCEVSGKAYRIIPMELAFYRKMGIPIPRVSPFERHRTRLRFIADHRKLFTRVCGKCGKSIKSVYKEDEYPIAYCETCYQAEVA